ncbi:MAG: MarR family transcriptional regulator [Smithella sp.]|jgi:DNA-binding MarR family transcriptional regulator
MINDDRLIYLTSMAYQTLMHYTNTALSKAGLKVTTAQAGTLFLLKQKNMCMMSEIGKVFNIDNSAVTRLIDRLEKNGLVKRRVPLENRRAILICITPEGLDEEKKAQMIIRSINSKIKEDFTSKEVESYKKILNGILEKFKVE